jgi:hypothetical protein
MEQGDWNIPITLKRSNQAGRRHVKASLKNFGGD